jgi:large subunit ribosomal protein L30
MAKSASGAAGKRAGKKAAAGSKLSVKQVRSGIGHPETYRLTLKALGLRHHQQTVVVNDTPSVRGMLFKVRHLVQVAPASEA